MFSILMDKTICLTRGDVANIAVSAKTTDGRAHTFKAGDVVRLLVYKKRDVTCEVIKKDVHVNEPTQTVCIQLESDDTRSVNLSSYPVEYWYQIVANPDTAPQTIIGHDESGGKIFRIYPGGGEVNER